MPLQFPEECEATEGRRQNVPPETWGWSAWTFLHAFAYSFPDKPSAIEKQAARILLENLNFYLPCTSCRSNVVAELKKHPLKDSDLQDATSFGKWMAALHNQVSARLGKPVMPYEQRVKSVLRGQAAPAAPHRLGITTAAATGDAGMVAGIVVTVLVALAVLAAVAVYYSRRRVKINEGFKISRV